MRRGEALELPWSSIDWQNGRLTAYAEKTGAKRVVPIVPKLHDILLETFELAEARHEHICHAVSRSCLWRNFQVIRTRAKLERWDDAFQVMRRNCETDWAQTFPQYAVSDWISHDITVSATHYLMVTEELYAKPSKRESTSEAPQNETGVEPLKSDAAHNTLMESDLPSIRVTRFELATPSTPCWMGPPAEVAQTTLKSGSFAHF